MTTAVYLRCSSQSQDIRSQEPDLQTWARAQAEPVTWFKDRFTGTSMSRPGLDKLLADARAGKINKVVVWRLDRLGRTARGLLALLDELQALGIGFVSLREGIDLLPRPERSAMRDAAFSDCGGELAEYLSSRGNKHAGREVDVGGAGRRQPVRDGSEAT